MCLSKVLMLGVLGVLFASCSNQPDFRYDRSLDFIPLVLTDDGVAPHALADERTSTSCIARPCVLATHGFFYDPNDPGYYSPYFTFFPKVKEAVPEPRSRLLALGWDSVTPTVGNALAAIGSGNLTLFGLARDRALELAPRLFDGRDSQDIPDVVVCHSLGCLLVVKALMPVSGRVPSRLVLVNGALPASEIEPLLLQHPSIEVVNVYTPNDRVVAIGAWLETGSTEGFVGNQEVTIENRNVTNVRVETENVGSVFGSGLDNPNRFFNHLYAIEGPGQADLLEHAILAPLQSEVF